MRKHPFICSACRKPVEWAGNQYEERIEIRDVRRSESLASKTVAYFCKACALIRRNDIKGSSAQEGLI